MSLLSFLIYLYSNVFNQGEYLRLYQVYIQHLTQNGPVIDNLLKTNKKFKDIVEDLCSKPKLKGMTIFQLLLRPESRFFEYVSLINVSK